MIVTTGTGNRQSQQTARERIDAIIQFIGRRLRRASGVRIIDRP